VTTDKSGRTSAGILLWRSREGRLEVLLAHQGGPFWCKKDLRDEEQRVVAAQEHALDGEKIAADDARRLRVQELASTSSRTQPAALAARAVPQAAATCDAQALDASAAASAE
jgi:hypothetical protein